MWQRLVLTPDTSLPRNSVPVELEDRWPFLGHFWAPSFQASGRRVAGTGDYHWRSLAEPLAEASRALAGLCRYVTQIQDVKPLLRISEEHVPLSSPCLSPLSNKHNTNLGNPFHMRPYWPPRSWSHLTMRLWKYLLRWWGASWYNHLDGGKRGNVHQKHVLCNFLEICTEETEIKNQLWGYWLLRAL